MVEENVEWNSWLGVLNYTLVTVSQIASQLTRNLNQKFSSGLGPKSLILDPDLEMAAIF